MFGLGMPELLIITFICFLLFGAGKLPEIGAGIGKGIRNFRKATQEDLRHSLPEKETSEEPSKMG